VFEVGQSVPMILFDVFYDAKEFSTQILEPFMLTDLHCILTVAHF